MTVTKVKKMTSEKLEAVTWQVHFKWLSYYLCLFLSKQIYSTSWQSALLLRKLEKVWTRLNQESWSLTDSQSGISAHQGEASPGQTASFKTLPDTLVKGRGRWAEEVSGYKRVMGDVRKAQSSTCSPWLGWNIQFPVCRWRDVPFISSEEITARSLCSRCRRTH